MMDGLDFICVDKVCEGLNHSKQNCPSGAEDKIQYFDENDVEGTYKYI